MLRRALWAFPLIVAVLVFWYITVELGWVKVVSSPAQVAKQMWDFAFGGIYDDAWSRSLHIHTWDSARRVAAGFGIAASIAIPLGILMGRSRTLTAMIDPLLSLLRPIPVTAWVPLVLIIVGLGTKPAVILIFIAAFYPILLNTIAGVKAVPPRLVEAAAMLGTRRWDMLYKVVLPSALPSIFAGMRIALGFSWVVVVVGETVGVPTGLGAVITEAREVSNTALIMTGMVFIGLAGFASDRLMTALIRSSLRNRPLIQT